MAVLVGCSSSTLRTGDDAGDGAPHDLQVIAPDQSAVDAGVGDADDEALLQGDVLPLEQDAVILEDLPLVLDSDSADRPDAEDARAIALEDAPPVCPSGAYDRCDEVNQGTCPNLIDGRAHRVATAGARADLPASCEGEFTRVGPDRVAALTLLNPSDVVVTARPTESDVVVVTLTPMGRCGELAGELRCGNSASSSSGQASVRALSLAPGNYAVAVTSARGRPVDLQAVVTPPGPRARGDVCPGVVVVPDGAAVTLNTTGFTTDADAIPGCMTSLGRNGLTDVVFTYTLTATRDVVVETSATGAGELSLEVSRRCGERGDATPVCAQGNPARATLRRQAPGTYFATATMRGAGRTLVTRVRTSAPTEPSPFDQCPGGAVTVPSVTSVSAAALSAGEGPACLVGTRADGVVRVTAPAESDDLVTVLRGASSLSLELRDQCDTTVPATCLASSGSLWRRWESLAPDTEYSLAFGSTSAETPLTLEVLTTPRTPRVMPPANDTCTTAFSAGASGRFGGTVDVLTPVAFATAPCGGSSCNGGRGRWYTLTLPSRQRVLVSTVGSSFDTLVSITAGTTCPGAPVSGACNNNAVGTASQLDVTLNAGQYFVVVAGCGPMAVGSYALDIVTAPPR